MLLMTLTTPALPTPRMLGLPESWGLIDTLKPIELETLAQLTLSTGCRSTLLASSNYRLAEAQLVCDALLSFAVVNRRLAAGGVATPDERSLLHALLANALGTVNARPYRGEPTHLVEGKNVPDSVVYRGLIELMLAGLYKLGAEDPKTTRLFDGLAADLVADYQHHDYLPSYRDASWPCDNAIAAAALALHGRLRHNDASRVTAHALAARLNALRQSRHGFVTQLNSKGRRVAGTPRGSAIAWATAFLKQGDFDEAAPFATSLLRDFCDEALVLNQPLAACREWPRGVDRGPDATSGPIVSGYGVAASALAIAATHGSAHEAFAQMLIDTATLAGLAGMTAEPEHYLLENVIFAWARSVRAW